MTPAEAFLRRQFADDPAVRQPDANGSAFGSRGLRVDGKVFAMEWNGAVAVKLPAGRVRALLADKKGAPLQMGSRVMKEWIVLRDPALWPDLAEEARHHPG